MMEGPLLLLTVSLFYAFLNGEFFEMTPHRDCQNDFIIIIIINDDHDIY